MKELAGKHILVTGGAGFIGSNLTEELLKLGAKVRVMDNLETGRRSNLEEFFSNPDFEFVEGDIRNLEDCLNALKGIDAVSHQAALGSVPRSIEFPHNTHAVNATGFLNMMHASKESGVMRFVYASSSSVYGDSSVSPKVVGSEGNLLSPYAVTKQLNEEYAKVYTRLHQMETVGLRYFNVFGPKQDPNGVYAAAIPKFVDAMHNGKQMVINGDGEQTRDFTYVKNAVNANLLALSSVNEKIFGSVYNVACGEFYSLNSVLKVIARNLRDLNAYNDNCTIVYGPDRPGDVRDSLADISQTGRDLNYSNPLSLEDGMKIYLKSMFAE